MEPALTQVFSKKGKREEGEKDGKLYLRHFEKHGRSKDRRNPERVFPSLGVLSASIGGGTFLFFSVLFLSQNEYTFNEEILERPCERENTYFFVSLLVMPTVKILVHVFSRFLSSPPLPFYLHLPLPQPLSSLPRCLSLSRSLTLFLLLCLSNLTISKFFTLQRGSFLPLRTHMHGLIPILQGSWKSNHLPSIVLSRNPNTVSLISDCHCLSLL